MHASGMPAECVGGHACMTQCRSTHAHTEESAAQMSLQNGTGLPCSCLASHVYIYSRKNLSVGFTTLGHRKPQAEPLGVGLGGLGLS